MLRALFPSAAGSKMPLVDPAVRNSSLVGLPGGPGTQHAVEVRCANCAARLPLVAGFSPLISPASQPQKRLSRNPTCLPFPPGTGQCRLQNGGGVSSQSPDMGDFLLWSRQSFGYRCIRPHSRKRSSHQFLNVLAAFGVAHRCCRGGSIALDGLLFPPELREKVSPRQLKNWI